MEALRRLMAEDMGKLGDDELLERITIAEQVGVEF